jgi:hypothetical protein
MKELFRVLTGTESLRFQQIVSTQTIIVVLEPLEDIITESLMVSAPSGPEYTRFTTIGFYKLLSNGHLNAIHSMFVAEQFVRTNSIEYQSLVENRQQMVCKAFFRSTIDDVKEIIKSIDKMKTVDKKDKLERKILAYALLLAAIDVSKNITLGEMQGIQADSEKHLNAMITDAMREVEEIIPKYPDEINRKLYYDIVRGRYLARLKDLEL